MFGEGGRGRGLTARLGGVMSSGREERPEVFRVGCHTVLFYFFVTLTP